VLAGILHHDRRRALVLSGELRAGAIEFHAVALDGAARSDVDVERGLAHRFRVEAAVFLLGDRQHVVEQDPGLVEAHRAMRRHVGRVGLGLVALDHGLDQVAQARRQRGRIEQLRGHRIDVAEVVDVLGERRAQLVELAVAGAVADQHLEAQSALARLPQEQRDVGIVAAVGNDVGTGAFELGYQRGEVGRGGGVTFAEHELQAFLLAEPLAGLGHADAIGPVLVDDRDLDVLRLLAKLRLGVLGEERRERLAVLVGMDLRAEHVLQVLVLEHRRRDRGRDPEDLLLRLDLGGERHRMGAGVDAVDDLDLFLADQALHLVDRNVCLALRIGIDRHHLVFAGNAAALVDEIDRDLGADRAGDRAAGGERAGQVVDHADPNGLGLGAGEASTEAQCGNRRGGIFQNRSARGRPA
jgi:hypothetical protein